MFYFFLLTFPIQEFRRRSPVQWNYRNIHWILKCAQWCLRAVSNYSGLSIGCSDMVYATSVVSPIHYCKHSFWCYHLSLMIRLRNVFSRVSLLYIYILYWNVSIPDVSVTNKWVWILIGIFGHFGIIYALHVSFQNLVLTLLKARNLITSFLGFKIAWLTMYGMSDCSVVFLIVKKKE